MDILALDADLDLAWPEPDVVEADSVGKGKLWKATFDDGRVVTAMPIHSSKTFRLNDASLRSDGEDRYGFLDVRKVPHETQWHIVVRVQTGACQSFLYPREVWISGKAEPDNFSTRGAMYASRRDAIVAGIGAYYAATRQQHPGKYFFDNHYPIVRIHRGEEPK